MDVSIFDSKGRLYQKINLPSGNQSIDITELPRGIYVFHLENDWQSKNIKVIKR
ncbi:T9SS type A sorting domain-containing protein [Flammeovirga pacifica]|uniref:T9SS type A sorting domain-containing protein n=1 Tax=Flammeovirga pacifica TaxID=915059 RepID=UPI000A012AD1